MLNLIKNQSITFFTINFMTDSDGNLMRGNACLNLVSDLPMEEIKTFIEKNNLLELSNHTKAHLVLMNTEEAKNGENILTLKNLIYPNALNASQLVENIRSKK